MNKKGDTSIMMDSIIHIIIFILFFLVMFWFVNSYFNGVAFLEEFYSKEIVRVINDAEPGMEFKIDITKLALAGSKSGKDVEDVISVDNVNNQIIASSRLGTGTSFGFFNDVDIVDWKVESPSGKPDNTRFIFKVKEKQR